MALNPSYFARLEEHGLSNSALEQLLLALDAQDNGSLTWHYAGGILVKFELRQYGSLQHPRQIQQAMKRAQHDPDGLQNCP